VTLRRQLFLAIGLVAALSVALAFAIGAVLARRTVEANTLRDVSAQADLLAERERNAALLACSRLPKPLIRRQGERVLCAPLTGPSLFVPPDVLSELKRQRPVDRTMELHGQRVFYAARSVPKHALVLMRPTSLAESAWRPHVEGLLVGALAALVLVALAAFLLARAISRPLARVAVASRQLAAEQSFEPVPEEGVRELASLARSFNEMAVRLARARAAEQQFLLSVSHELKTPLTAIRGYAEGLAEGAVPEDEAAETITRESERLERLVRDLLDLGRMRRSEFSVRREPIDLGAIARECAARYDGQARDFGVSLQAAATEPAGAVGDADRMVQVVSNLVENALRVAPPGGSVRIVATLGELAVADDGPGLAPDELPRAFERFYLYSRYGRERPVGTGLGLAIVKELVEGMGGIVSVESEPGRTVFTVKLPAPPPEDMDADVLRPAYAPRISA
jgi:two-component system sensor histidine kinase BaeS